MPDIRELAQANKTMIDTDRLDCERFRVRGFLATFHQTMPEKEVRRVVADVRCFCASCRRT